MELMRTTYSDALHQYVEIKEATALFEDAEEMQHKSQQGYRYLYSLLGFHYCDLLFSMGKVEEVIERAKTTLEWAKENNAPFLNFALDKLSLGKAPVLRTGTP